jgi:transposase
MRPPQKLHRSPEQRQELEEMRDRAPLPYMRERAAALLKIADGIPPLQVADHGLLRRRESDTIYRWLARYRLEGVDGLGIREGTRAPARFFPRRYPDQETATEALLHVVRRDPEPCGVQRSRWRLADLVQHCTWLNLETETGMWQLLHRCHISYQHAQEHIHSPDPQYQAKLEVIQTRLAAGPTQRGDGSPALSRRTDLLATAHAQLDL